MIRIRFNSLEGVLVRLLVEHRADVISVQIDVHHVGGGTGAGCIDQVNQSTSLTGEADAFLPHFGVATGTGGKKD